MDGSRHGRWTRCRFGLIVASIVASLLAPVGPAVVVAQEASPVAEGEALHEEVAFELLAQAEAEELPAAPAVIGLFRVTIEPGASDDLETGSGVELLLLEAGALSFRFAGPATVVQSGAAREPTAEEEVALNQGDAILVPAGIGFAVRNDGAEQAQVLGVVAFPAEEEMPAEGTPVAEEEFAPGITFLPLAFGVANDLPSGPAVIGLGRVTLEPGMSAPPEEPHPGPEIVVIESGTVAVTVTSGEAQVLRGAAMATPGAEPGAGELAVVGEEIVGEAGDALFAQTGSVETARNVGETTATALVAFFAPAGAEHDEAGTPAP